MQRLSGSTSQSRFGPVKRVILLLFGLLMIVLVTACPTDLLDEPSIVSMTITPSEITENEAGMTDEYFVVELQVANFDDEITGVEVYIQSPPRPAVSPVEIEGNTIILPLIAKTWFGSLPAGTYNIGAVVRAGPDGQRTEVRRNNLATVTVVEE